MLSEWTSFFRNPRKLELHKKVCENKDFCKIIISSEDIRILEFNQPQKDDKSPFVICSDLECTIKKIGGCKNNTENSYKTKVS